MDWGFGRAYEWRAMGAQMKLINIGGNNASRRIICRFVVLKLSGYFVM